MTNTGVIPLAVLCACLLLGGLATVILTRKIAHMRAALDLHAQRELSRARPPLVDVYVDRPRKLEGCAWGDFLPMAGIQDTNARCPHPHRAIDRRPGYAQSPFADGNVLALAVGIAMPRRPSADADMGMGIELDMGLEGVEYCIGTTDAVVCTLIGARQRLLGLN